MTRGAAAILRGAAVVVVVLFAAQLQSTPAAAQQRRVVVVGDSVILGARNQISSSFGAGGWAVTFDAAVSRSTSAGLAAIESHRAELTDSLVVSLGANDAGNTASYRQKVKSILDSTATVPHVYWVTIREVRDYYGPANQAVREVAAGRPNVTIIDWNAATLGTTDLTASDGLHLNAAGADRMARIVTDSVMLGALPVVATTAPQPTAPPDTDPPSTEVPTTMPATTEPVATTVPPATQEPAASQEGATDTTDGAASAPISGAREEQALERTASSGVPGRGAGDSTPGLVVAAQVVGTAVLVSMAALALAGLVLAMVVLRRSGAAQPPLQSPTHPAVRARRRAERIAASTNGTQES